MATQPFPNIWIIPLSFRLSLRYAVLSTVVFLLMCSLVSKASSAEFVLNNVNGPPYTTNQGDGFLDVIIAAAFQRAGADVRFVQLPPERGLINANEGIEDGELTRIAGIEAQYPNLIRVPEKTIDWNFSAFARKANFSTRPGWSELYPYSVGIMKGWKIAELNLRETLDLVYAIETSQLFRLLERERTDIVVYSREMGLAYIQSHNLQGVYLIDPPLETREMFIYLHKKHAAFVPQLAQTLRSLKTDGTYARLYNESVGRLTHNKP